MMGWLNVGSLVLGLIAWILPIVAMTKYKNHDKKDWMVLSMMSISACAISLFCQMVYHYYLVKIEDWSALMDTLGAVVFAATVLLSVTILLNVVTLILNRTGTVKKS